MSPPLCILTNSMTILYNKYRAFTIPIPKIGNQRSKIHGGILLLRYYYFIRRGE
jgi:hypothetical protein